TTATATLSATAAKSAAAFRLRTGLIDVQRPATQVLAVQALNRPISLAIVVHFYKAKAARSARFTVRQNCNTVDRAELLEHLTNIAFGRRERQVTYKNLFQNILLGFESGLGPDGGARRGRSHVAARQDNQIPVLLYQSSLEKTS